MDITFLGAAGTVTGSKFLLHHDGTRILVDCGYFQGLKQHRLMNWEKLPFDPGILDAVIITHAHLDHSGYLPVLVRKGFNGPIYCTTPTKALIKILLLDAAKIQEEDAEYANKKKFSKHEPAMPLFDTADVEKVLPMLIDVGFHEKFNFRNLHCSFQGSGHILGAASLSVSNGDYSVLFSGDLGRQDDPIMEAPEPIPYHDFIVMESTYGDRLHKGESSKSVLKNLIQEVYATGGVLLIPAFALGRAQNLLYEISLLKKDQEIPHSIPVYLNSPMGLEVTKLYKEHHDYHRLKNGEFGEVVSCCTWIKSPEQSRWLNEQKGPMVIIAASGMLTGGRILHHMKAFADDPRNIILLAGFQAAGTRGWSLKNGAKQLKIHGDYIPVKAKVIDAETFSAHADQTELLKWLGTCNPKPKGVFIVHGEPTASDELRKKIGEELKIPSFIPNMNQMYSLSYMAGLNAHSSSESV